MHLCQCELCAKRLVPLPATEVNHKTSKAEAKRLRWTQAQIDDPSNLEAINRECHKRVTAQQQGKTLAPKVTIGADGWVWEFGEAPLPRGRPEMATCAGRGLGHCGRDSRRER